MIKKILSFLFIVIVFISFTIAQTDTMAPRVMSVTVIGDDGNTEYVKSTDTNIMIYADILESGSGIKSAKADLRNLNNQLDEEETNGCVQTNKDHYNCSWGPYSTTLKRVGITFTIDVEDNSGNSLPGKDDGANGVVNVYGIVERSNINFWDVVIGRVEPLRSSFLESLDSVKVFAPVNLVKKNQGINLRKFIVDCETSGSVRSVDMKKIDDEHYYFEIVINGRSLERDKKGELKVNNVQVSCKSEISQSREATKEIYEPNEIDNFKIVIPIVESNIKDIGTTANDKIKYKRETKSLSKTIDTIDNILRGLAVGCDIYRIHYNTVTDIAVKDKRYEASKWKPVDNPKWKDKEKKICEMITCRACRGLDPFVGGGESIDNITSGRFGEEAVIPETSKDVGVGGEIAGKCVDIQGSCWEVVDGRCVYYPLNDEFCVKKAGTGTTSGEAKKVNVSLIGKFVYWNNNYWKVEGVTNDNLFYVLINEDGTNRQRVSASENLRVRQEKEGFVEGQIVYDKLNKVQAKILEFDAYGFVKLSNTHLAKLDEIAVLIKDTEDCSKIVDVDECESKSCVKDLDYKDNQPWGGMACCPEKYCFYGGYLGGDKECKGNGYITEQEHNGKSGKGKYKCYDGVWKKL